MSQQLNPLKGFRHPLDILVEVSRRRLDMGPELRRDIIAGFGCHQCTTVINVMGLEKVNQGNNIDREEQTKGSKNPRRKQGDSGHLQLFLVLLLSYWETTIGNNP